METKSPTIVNLSLLPDSTLTEVYFRDTSFFRSRGESPEKYLPHRDLVRERLFDKNLSSSVIMYQDLSLAVKCGPKIRIEEVVTLRMMNLLLPHEVPTPETSGWRIWDGRVYIYMALISGLTLYRSFDYLNDNEKMAIAEQLSQIVFNSRRLRQGAERSFLGSVIGGRLWDLYWCETGGAGPFDSVKAFNDGLQEDALPYVPMAARNFDDPYRQLLPDSGQIVFTHADINSHNIMISGSPGPWKAAALIDWEQSGWYPEYWEYCKMIGIASENKGWLTDGWAYKVMKPYEDEMTAWAELCFGEPRDSLA